MTSDLYFDNHTATEPSVAVVEAMSPYLTSRWGSPLSPHMRGYELLAPLQEAYEAIYAFLGAKESDSFVFTSSGAEAIAHVMAAVYLDRVQESGYNHFVVSPYPDAATHHHLSRLQTLGGSVTTVKAERGIVTTEALEEAITPRTALFSLSWAAPLTGLIQPAAELAAVCRKRGIWFHLDANHLLGKLPFDLEEIGADLLTFSGELMHAPRGTGGLWIREGLMLSPLILGGAEQGRLRGGPFSVAHLIALGVAAKEALRYQEHMAIETARLRDRLENGIVARCGGEALFRTQERLPTTAALTFPGIASDALLYRLSRKGLFTSFGDGSYQSLSSQLEAMGMAPTLAATAIPFTLSRMTTEEEVEKSIEVVAHEVFELRKLSQHVEGLAWQNAI